MQEQQTKLKGKISEKIVLIRKETSGGWAGEALFLSYTVIAKTISDPESASKSTKSETAHPLHARLSFP